MKNGDVIGISGTTYQLDFNEKAKGDDSSHIVCKNNTGGPINLSMGFAKRSEEYEPILAWTRVGGGSNATAQFKPKLTAYVTRDYEVNKVLRGGVETDAIWSIDLDEIDDVTGWNFVQDDATGGFSIVPATSI
ncbi:hypothetical protein RSOLAG1IB_11222 [Rhizoctonia solani AG-1 IB]|uniref:Uncharacterized protein n=1 Tax=Thanatephorus cucumeris (strain AG1-IB / isolate 7/3/14) TaxID=1108050 RepID=A0A0B7F6F2_THACB|nr:hypothetical protein RSOLAG1IB_11222 [Rhizoctonia solani AG-1 IB]